MVAGQRDGRAHRVRVGASGEIILYPWRSGTRADGRRPPSFDPGDGENAPLWNTAGTQLLVSAAETLARGRRPGKGRARSCRSRMERARDRCVCTDRQRSGRPTEGGPRGHPRTEETGGRRSAIWQVALDGGTSRQLLVEMKKYGGSSTSTSSRDRRDRHPCQRPAALAETSGRRHQVGVARQATHLNAALGTIRAR